MSLKGTFDGIILLKQPRLAQNQEALFASPDIRTGGGVRLDYRRYKANIVLFNTVSKQLVVFDPSLTRNGQ